jgi:hypothetical protein
MKSKRSKTPDAVTTHMGPMISRIKETDSSVERKYPIKLARGQINNDIKRPLKR